MLQACMQNIFFQNIENAHCAQGKVCKSTSVDPERFVSLCRFWKKMVNRMTVAHNARNVLLSKDYDFWFYYQYFTFILTFSIFPFQSPYSILPSDSSKTLDLVRFCQFHFITMRIVPNFSAHWNKVAATCKIFEKKSLYFFSNVSASLKTR